MATAINIARLSSGRLPRSLRLAEGALPARGLAYLPSMGRYMVLDDIAVADCALDAVGRDLSDLFETVARAVAEIMVDPLTITVTDQREISLVASALDLLLFDWIAELIFLKDSEQLIITQSAVSVSGSPACRLIAQVAGGRIDRARTILRADVKAPTLHLLAVEPVVDGWRARIVLDV